LIKACNEAIVQEAYIDNVQRDSPVFLSLICELAVLPETYQILDSLLNEPCYECISNEDLDLCEDEMYKDNSALLNWEVNENK
jgi:hypothetical protein